jgi:DNA-binding MarR family transcriptional regulator/N-acetylglutamate synthase-like GNAT family acetyltransferase
MRATELDVRAAAVRRFNRFYTRQIGVLNEGLYRSPFSLTEVRVLYELAHRENATASDLIAALGLDAGYLSRILRGFERSGLLGKKPSATDGRQSLLALTRRGQEALAPLEERAHEEVRAMLRGLSVPDQRRLVEAMRSIEGMLGPRDEAKAPYLLRSHRPGDMGFVVHQHGVLYAEEYGYNEEFEALVASIVASFLRHYDETRERCFIAEKDGEIVGSVFLVRKSNTVAKLRLLLVDPKARGLGIGSRLVGECVQAARQFGYRKITLWTQSELLAARHLYRQAGFERVDQNRHRSFGKNLVAETWELKL